MKVGRVFRQRISLLDTHPSFIQPERQQSDEASNMVQTTAFPMGNKPFVLLVGVMVGFFIGRFPSLKTLPWCVAPFQSQKMIEKKNQDEFSGVAPASTNTSITKDIVAVEPEIHRAQKNGLNVIEEVIPPKPLDQRFYICMQIQISTFL